MKYLLLITIIFSHLVFANNKAIEKPDPTNKKLSHELQAADTLQEKADTLQEKVDGGDKEAQYELGMSYLNGWGVKKNLKKAMHWFTQAANQSNSDAKHRLEDMYHYGGALLKLEIIKQNFNLIAKKSIEKCMNLFHKKS